ncbi:MAG: hypothetical protein O3A00_23375 [Planctomycetota bacterium]|nr:hypothetical protein [Planctomycetota bacterium]
MKVQQFLEHHGVTENPYGQEDAQSDHVFKSHCLFATHHPAWDKIYGRPDSPSTSVIFGEKGSGKTALRLQVVEELKKYNDEPNNHDRAFVIEYDDFNPFLDAFRDRLHGRKRRPDRVLANWRLWDHMDAILKLGVTRLSSAVVDGEADGMTASREDIDHLSLTQKRDLLLLAAFYNHSFNLPPVERWTQLKRKIRFSTWRSEWDRALAVGVTLLTVIVALWSWEFSNLFSLWTLGFIGAGWFLWLKRQFGLWWTARRTRRQVRVFEHLTHSLRRILSRFERPLIAGQPTPSKDRSDDRYELLTKFQSILKSLGYGSIVVLVDRVDEPHLVNGSAERMKELLWPMFDNKLLKHPGMCFKMLLPAEMTYYLNREKKEFYERSRLDKQNLIQALEWTGESLYDVANDRLRACVGTNDETGPAARVSIRNFFVESVEKDELIHTFAKLRVPRHLFKFLYRVIVDHCNRHTDEQPEWYISRETLQSNLAVYQRELEAFDRGMGTG